MLRRSLFAVCVFFCTGCASVIDRGTLQRDIHGDEGIESAGINIVAHCSFSLHVATDNITNFNSGTCAFLEDRLNIYRQGHSEKLEKRASIRYIDMKSVALYSAGLYRQLQIAGTTNLALEITSASGFTIDQESSRRIHDYLIEKGVTEGQTDNFIHHGTPSFFPIPSFMFIPFI